MSCLIFLCFWVVVVLPLVLLLVAPCYITETGDSKNARRIRAGRKRWVGGGDDTSPKHSERMRKVGEDPSPNFSKTCVFLEKHGCFSHSLAREAAFCIGISWN